VDLIQPGQFWLTLGEMWFIIAPYVEYDGAGTMWHAFRIPVTYNREPTYQLVHSMVFERNPVARVVA